MSKKSGHDVPRQATAADDEAKNLAFDFDDAVAGEVLGGDDQHKALLEVGG